MVLKIWSLVIVSLLVMLLSGLGSGADLSYESFYAPYYPDNINHKEPNLFIGGILQKSPNADRTDSKWRDFADNNKAIFVPTYYSLLDANLVAVNLAAQSGRQVDGSTIFGATDENGLTRNELNGKKYDTIIAYSGGTTTVVTAMADQNVEAKTLILISPMMGGALGDTFDYKGEFEKRLQKILRRGTKIIVIQSPDDTLPLGDESLIAAGFQYRFLENDPNTPSWLNEIEVHTVKLDKEWYETGHNYFFDTYAVENIKNGVYVDPQGTSTSLEANFDSGKDSDSPIVQAFQVTPLSLTTGESFTIDYTVSDIDGSGLKQVELWRKDEQSDWREIKRNELSGKYWYGVHVVDNAGNWNDETNSNTNNPSVSFGPIEVEIKKAQGSGSSVVGKWACQSSDECVTNYDWSTSETDTAVSNIGNFYIDFYNDGTFIISNEENTETTIGEWTQYGNTIRFQCKPFEEEIHDENAYGYQTIVWQSKGDTYEGTIDGDTISGTISSSFYIGGRYRNEPDSRPSHDIGEVSCPGRWSASRI